MDPDINPVASEVEEGSPANLPTHSPTHPPNPRPPPVFMSERSNNPDGETGRKKTMGPSSVVSTIGKIGMAITDECKDVGMAIAIFFFFFF